MQLKMAKRKEMEEGLSYPHAKLRRLDQMPHPTIEHVAFNSLPLTHQQASTETLRPVIDSMMHENESLPPLTSSPSEDRAIVLYNPSDTTLNFIPVQSNSSIVVSPELVHALKSHQGNNRILEDKSLVRNDSLAVVPWVPPLTANWPISQTEQQHYQAMVESEEDNSMEIETGPVQTLEASVFGANGGHERFYQHCMAPGAPPNPTTHLMQSR